MSRTQVRGNVQIQNTTISNDQIVDSTIVLGKLAEGTELIKRDGSVAFTGHIDLSSHKISNLAAPVSAMDAATKQYVDDATSGMVVTREVPTGDVNGSNMEFVLANTPNVGTEQVFVNGNLQQVGVGKDYTISGGTITFGYAPQSGDIILVNYIVDGVVLNADVQSSLSSLDSRVGALEASPGGGASSLDELSDVVISSASKGQLLVHDGSSFINSSTISAQNESVLSIVSPDNGYGTSTFNLTRVPADGKWNVNTGFVGLNFVTGAFSWTGVGIDLPPGTGPGAKLHVNCDIASKKGMLVKAHASQTENLLEVQNSSGSAIFSVDKDGSLAAGTVPVARVTGLASVATSGSYNDLTNKPQTSDVVSNSFGTTLTVSSGTLTLDASTDSVYLGTLSQSVTTWAFTSVPETNGKVTSITVIIAGDLAKTYGDACTVNGVSVSSGVKWSGGGAPASSSNTDVITFSIVRDNSGVIYVFGSVAVNFS